MALCERCQPIGNLVLTTLINDQSEEGWSWENYLCHHHSTWTHLQVAVKQGCLFCCLIDHYFRSTHVGLWRDKSEAPLKFHSIHNEGGSLSWAECIERLEARGEDTSMSIMMRKPSSGPQTLSLAPRLDQTNGYHQTFEELDLLLSVTPGNTMAQLKSCLVARDHIDPDPLSSASIATMSSWLEECVANHKACRLTNASFVPMRVIDVADEGLAPFLVETAGDTQYARYACLSHCWGTTKHLSTNRENIQYHKSGLDYEFISQTFKDAITLTRRLGLRYLWIDSICIVQDDAEDWEINAANMGSIYEHSLLTIAAIDAADGLQGFLHQRPSPAALPYDLEHERLGVVRGVVWAEPCAPSFDVALRTCVLTSRAWATQERLLAPRKLHCGKQRVMWECQIQDRVECQPQNFRAHDTMPRVVADFGKLTNGLVQEQDELDRLYDVWYYIIERYSKRSLTVPADRLPALAGLAKRFQQATGDVYCAGLWERDLSRALFWELWSPSIRCPLSTAPSWSWASFVSGVDLDLVVLHKGYVSSLENLEISITVINNNNPLGAVEHASLHCSALIQQVTLKLIGRQYPNHRYKDVCTSEDVRIGFACLDVESELLSMRAWALLVARNDDAPIKRKEKVLLLQELDHHVDTYRRIGILSDERREHDNRQYFLRGMERRQITIV